MQIAAPPAAGYSAAPPPVYSSTYGQTDETLANQVQQNLYSHPVSSGFAQNIRVIVQGGRVTLTGNVSSEQDRHVVDEVVRNTPGVVGVTDQMQVALVPTGRVQEPTRIYAATGDNFSLHVQGLNEADRTLAQRILEGMQTGSAVGGAWPGVTINVVDGRVILQGTVHSYEEKRAIFDAVQRAAGSNNVYNELHVVP